MATFKRTVGDSLWIDVTCPTADAIDPSWPNWSLAWSISLATIDVSAPILTGTVTPSATPGLFQLRIGDSITGWSALAPGNYNLTLRVLDSAFDFQHTEIHRLQITIPSR